MGGEEQVKTAVFRYFLLVTLACLVNLASGYSFKLDSLILSTLAILTLKSIRFGSYFFFFVSVLATLYIPVAWYYGNPSISIISAIFETNPAEAYEFIHEINAFVVIAMILFLPATWLLFKHSPEIKSRKSVIKLVLVFLGLFMVKPIKIIHRDDIQSDYVANTITHIRFIPVKFIYDIYDSYKLYNKFKSQIAHQQKLSPSWEIIQKPSVAKNTILVIGESVRRDHMNAYGFRLENTPFMSQANGEIWTNFLSAGPNTYASVARYISLTDGTNFLSNNNVITLANMSNIETYWISNQGRMGKYDTGVSALAHYAKHVYFNKLGDFDDSDIHDNSLLPIVKKALESSNKSKLIVVHLMGSHPSFCQRVEGDVTFNFHGKKMSCYIESIYQTDAVLKGVDDLAKEQSIDYEMIYVGDHGLKYSDNRATLRHNENTKQSYQVPLFITGSSFDSRKNVDYHRNGLNLIKALSEILGISTRQLDSVPSFFEPHNDALRVFNGSEMVDFEKLQDDPIVY